MVVEDYNHHSSVGGLVAQHQPPPQHHQPPPPPTTHHQGLNQGVHPLIQQYHQQYDQSAKDLVRQEYDHTAKDNLLASMPECKFLDYNEELFFCICEKNLYKYCFPKV